MENKTMGSFIAVLRKSRGMTQKELAELLNVSDKAVSRWEREESMPDIGLLPILADIFEVTCDELLRGERQPKADREEAPQKREHRIHLLLKRRKNRFQAFSILPLALSLLGFLLAVCFNFLLHRATMGFYAMLFGLLPAFFFQIALYFYFKGECDTDDLDSPEVFRFQKMLRDRTVKTCCLFGVLFGFCLPLLLFGQMDYFDYIAVLSETMAPEGFIADTETTVYTGLPSLGTVAIGLNADTWLWQGSIGAFVFAFIGFLTDYFIRRNDVRKQRYQTTPESFQHYQRSCLSLGKHLLLLAILLLGTWEASEMLQQKLELLFLTETVQFDNFEDFKNYMETPPEDMYEGVIELRQQLNKYHKEVYDEDGTLLCEYRQLNDHVTKITYGKDHKLPIKVYTEVDASAATQKAEDLMKLRPVLLAAECGVVLFLFFRKQKTQ